MYACHIVCVYINATITNMLAFNKHALSLIFSFFIDDILVKKDYNDVS